MDGSWEKNWRMKKKRISIVIPCYNTSDIIYTMMQEIKHEMGKMEIDDYEVILVDDFSPKREEVLERLQKVYVEYDFVKVIELAKNTGQHNAIMAGLNYAEGDIIVGMDDDMQTHPSQLSVLLEELEKGYDLVYGYYPEKKHSLFRNFGSWVNYESVRIMIGKPKELKTSSYWVIRRYVRDEAIRYTQPFTYLQGVFLRITRNISSVPIQHFERQIGTSNYSFKSLVKLWGNISGFSLVPLRLSTYAGNIFAGVGVIGAIIVVIRKILHPDMAVGWPSLMAAIFFFSGIILLFMGLIGEYIGRMFLGLNNTPQYVVREVHDENWEDK